MASSGGHAHDVEAQTGNLQSEGNKSKTNRDRKPMAAMIEDFSPTWFAICMNSGILSILCHQLPYQFESLFQFSIILFVIDLVLFIAFSILMLLRLFLYFPSTCRVFSSSVEQLAFVACWPIAWLTLCSLTALIVSQSYWGGRWATILAYSMWWFGALWTFTTSVFVYMTLFRKNIMTLENATPAIIIPAVGVATVAATGGLISNYSFEIEATLQVPQIIVGYILLGQGIFLALMVYAILIYRLFAVGFLPPEKLPALILFLGPTGQSATALQLLGTAANSSGAFAKYHTGTFIQGASAASLDAASIMLSLLLFGFGIFLLCISLGAIAEGVWNGETKWNMTVWSTIFPMGTMNTAMLVYATEMDSSAWRVLTAALLIILVLDYLYSLVKTILGVVWGDLLIPNDAKRGKKNS